MANNNVRQSKLQKIGLELETTVGAYESTDANTEKLPVENLSFSIDRGTGLISRSAVSHGWATSLKGVVGTRAVTLSYDMEIQATDAATDELQPYWVKALAGCGMAVSSSATVTELYPTPKDVSDFTSFSTGENGPYSISHTWAENNNGTSDVYFPVKGCQGVPTFSFATGERALINFNWHGQLEDTTTYTVFSDVDFSQTNITDTSANEGNALVVKNMTCIIKSDNSSGTSYSDVQIDALTLNSNFELAERQSPCADGGFLPSAVFTNSEPTVTFALAENASTDDVVMTDFANGDIVFMSFTLTFNNAQNSTLQIVCPRTQLADAGFTDLNGYRMFSITARCIGDSGNPGTDTNVDRPTRGFWLRYNPSP